MEGGAQKLIIQNLNILSQKFIDTIKYSTSKTNMQIKLSPILSRNFTYNVFGELGSDSGKKSMFSRVIFGRQKYYENRARIRIKNKSTIIITYTYEIYTIIQTLFIENFKINYFSEEVAKANKLARTGTRPRTKTHKGGQGYSVMVEDTPIAGKPVIRSYYDCCRPVFSGGKADSGYYFNVGGNHLVVQPQYRAY
jgi:hypothetical protein